MFTQKQAGRVFTNGPGVQGSIPGWVIPKRQKMVLDTSLLNIQYYEIWIKCKWGNPGKRVAPSLSLWCSSYWKGSLWVVLDNGQTTYLIYKLLKLATVVEGHPKAPFSIATTPRCRGGSYSFPWIAPLYLDPYLIMPSVKQGSIKYHWRTL